MFKTVLTGASFVHDGTHDERYAGYAPGLTRVHHPVYSINARYNRFSGIR
jgi:hypothetical protein